MNGSEIIGALLRAYAPLTDVVAVQNIKGGRLPDATVPPAILVRTVSLIERQTLKRENWVRCTERVSVAVRAVSYRQQMDVIALVRDCCMNRVGNIGGAERVSILPAGLGPDLLGPGDTFEQTQDFKISFDGELS